jgi:hypothetical protein
LHIRLITFATQKVKQLIVKKPYQATPVRERTVAPHKDISSNGLPEYLNPKHICNKLLRLLENQTAQRAQL